MEKFSYAKAEERQDFEEWLWQVDTRKDPDKVSADVVADEMSLFHQARRQNG